MGENEQGGMLRTVVVVGLVALIAGVIIAGVVGMKASMTKNTATAVYNVEKVGKPYQFQNNGDLHFDAYSVGYWNGTFYHFPKIGSVPPGNWREVHFTVTPSQTSTLQLDINSYDNDLPGFNPSNNDNDATSQRVNDVYENGTLVGSAIPGKSNVKLEAGHSYQVICKWYNDKSRTLYDSDSAGGGTTAVVLGTPNGSAGSFKISDVEAATYKMP